MLNYNLSSTLLLLLLHHTLLDNCHWTLNRRHGYSFYRGVCLMLPLLLLVAVTFSEILYLEKIQVEVEARHHI